MGGGVGIPSGDHQLDLLGRTRDFGPDREPQRRRDRTIAVHDRVLAEKDDLAVADVLGRIDPSGEDRGDVYGSGRRRAAPEGFDDLLCLPYLDIATGHQTLDD